MSALASETPGLVLGTAIAAGPGTASGARGAFSGTCATGGTVSSTAVATTVYVACTPLVVGAQVSPFPASIVQEDARPAPTAATSMAATTNAIPFPSRPSLTIPAPSPLLQVQGTRLLSGVIARASGATPATPASQRLRPKRAMATLATTRPRTPIPYAALSTAKQIQRPETVTQLVARATAPTELR